MTITIDPSVGEAPALDRAVLAALQQQVLDESTVDNITGCALHPTGRVRMFGGVFSAKRVTFEHVNGPVLGDAMVVRTCSSEGCVEPAHHVVQTRQQFGAWLGQGTGWRQRASV